MFSYKETKPDFALTYSALARRIAAAHSLAVSQDFAKCRDVLNEAMAVIKQVETTHVVVPAPPGENV